MHSNLDGRHVRHKTAAWFHALAVCVLAWCPIQARAADNAALGGIGGIANGTLVGGDGTGDARVSLYAVDLALVKQARALDGTVLPDQAVVIPGNELYFLLYVDNTTDADVPDLQITDLLDETQFAYVPGSLEYTLVPSGSSDPVIWSGAWLALTDALGVPDDPASIQDTGGRPGPDRIAFGADPTQINQPLRVPAHQLRAVRFRVRVL